MPPWQPHNAYEKCILAALKKVSACYLDDVLDHDPTPEERAALIKAARTLAIQGKLAIARDFSDLELAAGLTLVVHRTGEFAATPRVRRLK
jgi:hypothetical protein